MEVLPPALRKHFLEPVGAGALEGADLVGSAANAACGDRLALGLWLADGRVLRARFQAGGCSSLIAAASLFCERVGGTPQGELAALDPAAWLREAGGLPRRGVHAGAVVQRALDEAVRRLHARYP